MKYEKYMKIEDKYKACRAIALSEELGLVEIEEAMEQYARMHGIPTDEMAFYPNGDKVIQ